MGSRALIWALTLPLVGTGVLVGHDLTYRLVGDPDPAVHDYLRHLPQLIAILATVGLVGLAVDQRSVGYGTARFGSVGLVVYALQEHVERLVHTGSVPFILTDRAFVVGLALQVPIGLACLGIARAFARELGAAIPLRLRAFGSFMLQRSLEAAAPVRSATSVILRGRSPPPVIGSPA